MRCIASPERAGLVLVSREMDTGTARGVAGQIIIVVPGAQFAQSSLVAVYLLRGLYGERGVRQRLDTGVIDEHPVVPAFDCQYLPVGLSVVFPPGGVMGRGVGVVISGALRAIPQVWIRPAVEQHGDTGDVSAGAQSGIQTPGCVGGLRGMPGHRIGREVAGAYFFCRAAGIGVAANTTADTVLPDAIARSCGCGAHCKVATKAFAVGSSPGGSYRVSLVASGSFGHRKDRAGRIPFFRTIFFTGMDAV